ncbi:hypothetical protein PG984_008010 [Apiospora sp. TS-2023a]
MSTCRATVVLSQPCHDDKGRLTRPHQEPCASFSQYTAPTTPRSFAPAAPSVILEPGFGEKSFMLRLPKRPVSPYEDIILMVVAALVVAIDNTAANPSLRVGPIAAEYGIPSSSSVVQSAVHGLSWKPSPLHCTASQSLFARTFWKARAKGQGSLAARSSPRGVAERERRGRGGESD